jgi:hypothetical protein
MPSLAQEKMGVFLSGETERPKDTDKEPLLK